MAPAALKWLWHLGSVATAIYTVVFVVDFGLHFHEGWSIGVRERDWILDARRDCEVKAYTSALMQEQCGQIRARQVVVPWHVAVHHVGRHLMTKLTSALQSAFALVCILVPLALLVFYCAVRHQQQREQAGYYGRETPLRHRHGEPPTFAACSEDALRFGATALWETLRWGQQAGAGAPKSTTAAAAGEGGGPQRQPGSVVLDMSPARGKKSE